ncbi:hypothetical protein [Actinoplanes sp. NPDC049265]|uniref:hypothetical protein n=1 Tax=Actinoplanes sp. NPDC049265 TaxID=3363902 RepID=UPI0037123716
MSDDPVADLRVIGAELIALGRAARAASRPDARYEGSDATGTITVVLDGRQRVVDVRVDMRWDQRLARTELGPALSAAYSQAVIALLDADSEAFDEARAAPPVAPVEPAPPRPAPVYTDADVDEMKYQLDRQLQQNDMLLRFADQPPAARGFAGEAEVTGPGEFVIIAVRNGRIADIRVLASRLPADSTNGTIAREAMEAFRATEGFSHAGQR